MKATFFDSYSPDAQGSLATRVALGDYLGRCPNSLLLTSTTSEAFELLFKLLADPGDEILIPTPGYPLLELLLKGEGLTLKTYELRFDGAWSIDLETLHRSMSTKTRAIVVVSPHNPTGHSLSEHEWSSLEATGIPLVVDEVFSAYSLVAKHPRPPRTRGLSFSLGGASKTLALPQLKMSWIAVEGQSALVGKALNRLSFLADLHLSVSQLAEKSFEALVDTAHRSQATIRARMHNNFNELVAQLEGPDACTNVLPYTGSWSAIVRLPSILSDEAWALYFLKTAKVRVDPGYFFDLNTMTTVIVSLLTEPELLREGAQRIANAVDAYVR